MEDTVGPEFGISLASPALSHSLLGFDKLQMLWSFGGKGCFILFASFKATLKFVCNAIQGFLEFGIFLTGEILERVYASTRACTWHCGVLLVVIVLITSRDCQYWLRLWSHALPLPFKGFRGLLLKPQIFEGTCIAFHTLVLHVRLLLICLLPRLLPLIFHHAKLIQSLLRQILEVALNLLLFGESLIHEHV